MKLEIESTNSIVKINGIECRVWEGKTESGIPVHCFITRIAVHKDHDHSELDRELKARPHPNGTVSWPLHMLID